MVDTEDVGVLPGADMVVVGGKAPSLVLVPVCVCLCVCVYQSECG